MVGYERTEGNKEEGEDGGREEMTLYERKGGSKEGNKDAEGREGRV